MRRVLAATPFPGAAASFSDNRSKTGGHRNRCRHRSTRYAGISGAPRTGGPPLARTTNRRSLPG